MEKADRETKDFMNVNSFSQLPFIRPAPPPPPPPSTLKEKPIKLFGIEFGRSAMESESEETTEDNTSAKEADNNIADSSSNNRRFECHYCCRNFPTSQALGGHQNAHKRERQHAKRAHLQSAIAHDYNGFLNYRSIAPTYANPSWTSYNSHYGSMQQYRQGNYSYASQQPINGSPLGLWRIPTVHHGSSTTSFRRDRFFNQSRSKFSGEDLKGSSRIGGSSSQGRFGLETNKDHVSLDLHL